MTTLVIVGLIVGLAATIVALIVRRRLTVDAPSVPRTLLPTQLDRRDFPHPDREWLAVLFSSTTCAGCSDARAELVRLDQEADVGVVEVDAVTDRHLHQRYAIESVPAILIADADGVVVGSALGPPPAGSLRVELARLRSPDG